MTHDSEKHNGLADTDFSITRRDFVGTTLLGAGAALLSAPSPSQAQGLGQRSWTGYGGVGDYRFSNGNTADVVNSAHQIRDGAYDHELGPLIDTGEVYDAVIVGAGFAGMSAIYEFKAQRPDGTCLVLDNHPIFGGEAKQNEFDVDGYRLAGPQGSNAFTVPSKNPDPADQDEVESRRYWNELNLPEEFEFAKVSGGAQSILFAKENFSLMYSDRAATIGYFFQNELTRNEGVWHKNIWNDELTHAPIPEPLKKDLLVWRDYQNPYARRQASVPQEFYRWLDSMSLSEYVTNVIGLSLDVLKYASPGIAAAMTGAWAGDLSAYMTLGRGNIGRRDDLSSLGFPGGNTPLLRHFVKAVFPDAITGPKEFHAISANPVNLAALDRPGAKLKMRLRATAVSVTHEGDPKSAEHVNVVYEKDGKLYRVKAKGVVLAIGSWVAKHIARDLSAEYLDALTRIPHGPILTVNVALRNWRFMDKLGISAARWFDGFGFMANIRQSIIVGDRAPPLRPDKPAVMTFYVPFLRPGLPLEAQGPAARAELWSTSYASFEKQIVEQMQRLFTGAGFNAKRDIAGIVLNRWGHALFSPPPGFYFGKDGKPSPLAVLGQPFGRIAFGHSEVSGHRYQTWEAATFAGKRALLQVI